MGLLDLALSLGVVGLAAAFIVSRFRAKKGPACHPDDDAAPRVEVGGALARGLERARKRRP